jgi:hypothetical protein
MEAEGTMRILRSLAIGYLLPAGGPRSAATVAALLLIAALTAASCGSEETPAEEFFSRSDQVLRRLVPDANAFSLRLFSAGQDSESQVDFIVSTALDGEPRMHVVSDEDAVAGADLVDEYEGFDIYLQKATSWAELVGEPAPLYAGTPNREGLRSYVDFYVSGEPVLTDERFWNGFDYVQKRIGEVLKEEPSLLVVDFEGEWKADVGGVRVEVTLGTRRLYVGVLHAREGVPQDSEGFDEELVAAFKQRFAVPSEAEEQPSSADWDYGHRIWFLDTSSGGGEQ